LIHTVERTITLTSRANDITPDAPRSQGITQTLAQHDSPGFTSSIGQASSNLTVESSDTGHGDDLAGPLVAGIVLRTLDSVLRISLSLHPSSSLVAFVQQRQEGGTNGNDGRGVGLPGRVPLTPVLLESLLYLSYTLGFGDCVVKGSDDAGVVDEHIDVGCLLRDFVDSRGYRRGRCDVALDWFDRA